LRLERLDKQGEGISLAQLAKETEIPVRTIRFYVTRGFLPGPPQAQSPFEVKDGHYLLLSWLGTRRGIIVFILLFLMTAVSSLYRLASNNQNANQPVVKANSSKWESSQQKSDGNINKNRHPRKPLKSDQPE
jgi:MerR HTH family regulatory protein